jgi:hypothetical protein
MEKKEAGEYWTLLGVRVPPSLMRELRERAQRENNGVSAYVRRVLTQALETDRRAEGGCA